MDIKIPTKIKKEASKENNDKYIYKSAKDLRKKLYEEKQWYTCRALLGNQWANWYIMAGARERGKTFSVQDFVLNKFFNPKSKLYHKPFY